MVVNATLFRYLAGVMIKLMGQTAPKIDFREAGVAASEAMLAEHRRAGKRFEDPIELGIPYCLPIDGDGPALLRRLRWRSIAALVGGFAGLLGGAFIASRAERMAGGPSEWVMLAMAVCCSLTGFVFLFYGATAQQRLVRKLARDRIRLDRENGARPMSVGIEDGATYQKMKPVPEDVGALLLHPASQCLQIEGLTHRYLIYAEDVCELAIKKTPSGSRAVVLSYEIGTVRLQIALFDNTLWTEFKRQTIGGRSRLFENIERTLQLAEPV